MKDPYQIDLENYSLQKFKQNLDEREMIPSRIILKDEVDERFKILETKGITNLKELIDVLGTKEKVELFSKEKGLTVEYLTLLKREAKSYLSNPVSLDRFPGVKKEYLKRLSLVGINNTRQLFNNAYKNKDREQLAEKIGISIESQNELVGLSDLSRAYGIGPVFARMVYDLGIKSIKSFIEYSAADLIQIYKEQTQKKADFGFNEIEFSLSLAKELDVLIE